MTKCNLEKCTVHSQETERQERKVGSATLDSAESLISRPDISICNSCNCITKSIRIGRANYRCGKCQADKTLSDYYQWELKKR